MQMNLERLQTAWRSSANNPSRAASAYLMSELAGTLRRRRAIARGQIMFVFAACALVLIMFTINVTSGRGAPIDWAREWAVLPYMLAPLAAALLIWRLLGRFDAAHPQGDLSLAESFRALRDWNSASRTRLRVIAATLAASGLALFVLIPQLAAVGKIAPAQTLQMAIVLGGGLVSGATFVAFSYFAKLGPERRRLEALIRQYEQAEA
jgi:hypothetical protein